MHLPIYIWLLPQIISHAHVLFVFPEIFWLDKVDKIALAEATIGLKHLYLAE